MDSEIGELNHRTWFIVVTEADNARRYGDIFNDKEKFETLQGARSHMRAQGQSIKQFIVRLQLDWVDRE